MNHRELLCPNCGEPMKHRSCTAHEFEGLGPDTDFPTVRHYSSYTCKECKIKANNYDYHLEDTRAWSIPQALINSATISSKQLNLMRAIGTTLHIDVPFFLGSSLASQWISEHIDDYKKVCEIKTLIGKKEDICRKYGYNQYRDFGARCIQSIFVSDDGKLHRQITINYKQNDNIDAAKIFQEMEKDWQAIKKETDALDYWF